MTPVERRVRRLPREWQEWFLERAGMAIDSGMAPEEADAWAWAETTRRMREVGA